MEAPTNPPHTIPVRTSVNQWTPRYILVQALNNDQNIKEKLNTLLLTSNEKKTANEKVLAAWEEKKLYPFASYPLTVFTIPFHAGS